MTADLEFTGKNVDKAVELAATTLGIPREEVRFDILSHGASGIFGLAGIKKARILVRQEPYEKICEEAHPVAPESTRSGSKVDPQPVEAVAALGEAVLRRMVEAISPEATISVETQEQRVRFVIEGGQSGILIGKRGQTLEAMQLIVEKAIRRVNGNKLRLQVDVEGYLSKKKAGLVRTAEQMAQKVVANGSPTSIGSLNAQDRRVVHLALKQHQDVRTQSIGEGPLRKLMIFPKRNPKNRS